MRLRYALLPALVLCASVMAMAEGPFDGTWILNQEKSQLAGDTIHFAPAGDGAVKYTDSAESYTFNPDGTPVKTPLGRERSIKKADDQTYEVTSKNSDGTPISTSTWKLSEDGKTLSIDVKGTKPNGESFEDTATYVRTTTGKGLIGSWKSREVKMSSPNTFVISSSGESDVTLGLSDLKAVCDAKWDGKDYPASGPTVPPGITLAVTKTGPHSFKMVQKLNGKAISIEHYTLSADGKTLTGKGTNGEGKEPFTEVMEKRS